MAERVARHLQETGRVARTVSTKVRYSDFSIRSRSTSLRAGIDDANQIGELACGLLDRALAMYGAVWALLSWLGLSWIYVISHYEYSVYLDSSKARVVATLAVGAAALTPLLAGEAWVSARGRDRPHAGAAQTSSPPRGSASNPLRARPR